MHGNTDQEPVGQPGPEIVGPQAARGQVDAMRTGRKRHVRSSVHKDTAVSRVRIGDNVPGKQEQIAIIEVLLPYLDEIDAPADQSANMRPKILRAKQAPVGHVVIERPPSGKLGCPNLS